MPFPELTRHIHPVLAARDLGRTPRRVELGGHPYVLWRERCGRAVAFEDRCPHRFAPLSQGRVTADGLLACAYHGWRFDAAGQGVSPSQPTLKRCGVRPLRVFERFGYLWLTSSDTTQEAFPDLGVAGYELAGSFGTRFAAPLHVAFDNFSEDEHTPWVHHFLGWTERDAAKIQFQSRCFDDRTQVSYVAPQRPDPWLPLVLASPGDLFHNQWVTRFSPVHSVYALHWTSPHTGVKRPVESRVAVFFVPETDTSTWLHAFVFVRAPRSLKWLSPLIKRVALRVTQNEVRDDAKFIPHLARTPFELKGMRLSKFDAPLIRNHRLLVDRYLERFPSTAPAVEVGSPEPRSESASPQ